MLAWLTVGAVVVGCAAPTARSTDEPGSPSIPVASAEPSPTVVPSELFARHIALDQPAIDMTLPIGWREVTVRDWREDIAGVPEDAALRGDPFVTRLQSGQVLTTAEGYTDEAINVYVELDMKAEATSIEDAMSSVSDELARTGEVEDIETGVVNAPVGPVVRARYVIKSPENNQTALPTHFLAYIAGMGSDGILVITSLGLQADASHQRLLDAMISTLRGRETLLPRRLPGPWVGRVEGTDLTFVYPEPFIPIPLDGYRSQLVERIENGLPGGGPEAVRTLDGIEGGIIRAQLSSRRPMGSGRYLRISVESDVDDLDEAVDRALGSLDDPEVVFRHDGTHPLGPATRLRVTVPDSAAPAFDDLYVVMTDEGESLSINGRAAQDDAAFESIFQAFAESFERE